MAVIPYEAVFASSTSSSSTTPLGSYLGTDYDIVDFDLGRTSPVTDETKKELSMILISTLSLTFPVEIERGFVKLIMISICLGVQSCKISEY